MVTRMQASEAVSGGPRSLGRGWAKLSNRPLVALAIIAAVLAALFVGVVASGAYRSDPAAAEQAQVIQQDPGAVTSRERQQFLEKNMLPDTVGTGVVHSPSGSQQRQLAAIEARDNGAAATSVPQGTRRHTHLYGIERRDNALLATDSAAFDSFAAPCPPFESTCRR